MDFFDLHCDTLTECFKYNQSLYRNSLAVSTEKAKIIERWCQCFAVFIPDNLRCVEAFKYYKDIVDFFKTQLSDHNSIVQCRSDNEILDAVNSKRCAAILTVESGAAIGCDIENLYELYNDGVRILGLTWNGDNELAGGVYGSGKPLTDLGKNAVMLMNDLGIIIDVSHLSERCFWQVMDLSSKPVVATHSNFNSIKNHRRNLTDEQFAAICKSGGVVGINFYTEFLGNNGFDDVLRHLNHALELGGENNISFGSDFDGCDINFSLNSIDKMANLCDYLLRYGFNEQLLSKLCFDNALRLFK